MACGGCGRKNRIPARVAKNDLKGNIKYLTRPQIVARLDVYKRKYCKACNKKHECDYSMYFECENGGQGGKIK